MRPRVWVTTGLLLCAATAQGADTAPVYRWTDAQGVVNYGTEAPVRQSGAQAIVQLEIHEPVVNLEADVQRIARLQRERDALALLEAAREARLKQQLLEEQLATEQARAALLRAQAAALNSGGSYCGGDGYGCAPTGLVYARWPQRAPRRPSEPLQRPHNPNPRSGSPVP